MNRAYSQNMSICNYGPNIWNAIPSQIQFIGCEVLATSSSCNTLNNPIVFRRNATYCISHYAIIMCMCVCLCVCLCVYMCMCVCVSVCVSFFKLLGITPDITCKSFTQIGLQIPRWRTKWRT